MKSVCAAKEQVIGGIKREYSVCFTQSGAAFASHVGHTRVSGLRDTLCVCVCVRAFAIWNIKKKRH